MDAIRWPGLDARLRGRRVGGLRHEPEAGFVVVELEDGGELWISADWEGCSAGVYIGRIPSTNWSTISL